LAEVRVQEGEPLENALRRFKRKVQQEDIIKEVKRHSYYLKPGEKRRVKEALARKRNRKKARFLNAGTSALILEAEVADTKNAGNFALLPVYTPAMQDSAGVSVSDWAAVSRAPQFRNLRIGWQSSVH